MERSRREVLIGGLAIAGCAGAPSESLAPPPPAPVAPDALDVEATGAEPRNVVLILTDDQRWNSFSFLGHPFLETPNLDRIAREGAVCSNAFVTTSLCCPSRASMLTGLYAHAHGVLDNSAELDPAFPTYAPILERAGVDTAFIGKWHMGGDDPHPRPGWKRWIGFRGQGRYVYPGPDPEPLDRGFSFDGEMREVAGYVTDLLTDQAVEYLSSRDGKTPFCLVLSHKAVHAPFVPAERHRDKYAEQIASVPAVLPDTPGAYAELPAWLREMRHHTEFGVERPYGQWPDFASWYLDYHRTLLAVDDGVGRILATLESKGLRDRTAVLFTSDNGFMFGEKGVLDKRNFYEPSIRVPLLGFAPGLIQPGSHVDRFVLNVDLAPTVLDLCGYRAPEHWHGRSILPLLSGQPPDDWRQEFVYEYFYERLFGETPTMFGLRTPKTKLSTSYGVALPDELYDLDVDPEERHNVIDDPDYADRRKAMKTRMTRHFGELGMLPEPVWGRNWLADPTQAAAPLAPRETKAKAKARKGH